MNIPKSAVTLLYEAIKSSERMRGVDVLWSAKRLPDGGSPDRIVLTPTSETHVPPENNDNWLDAVITVEATCWGATFDVVRYLRGAFIQTIFDNQFLTNLLRLTFIGGEFDADPDTERDGWCLVLTFSIRDSVDKVPLSANSGSAVVVAEQYAPDAVSAGPTINIP